MDETEWIEAPPTEKADVAMYAIEAAKNARPS